MNNINKEVLKKRIDFVSRQLKYKSEVIVELTTTKSSSSNNKVSRIYPTNWEYLLWKAPAKITIDATQIFRDFGLGKYNVVWDLDEDLNTDRTNQVNFDYYYLIPQVYYPSYKFPDLSDFIYSFPVRVEQSDRPVCYISLEKYTQLWIEGGISNYDYLIILNSAAERTKNNLYARSLQSESVVIN